MKLLDPAQFTSHSSSNEKTLIECVKTLKSAYTFIQASDASIVKQFQTLYGDSELKSLMSDIKAIGTLTEKLYELDIHEALPLDLPQSRYYYPSQASFASLFKRQSQNHYKTDVGNCLSGGSMEVFFIR